MGPDVLALSGKFSCATQNDLANSSHPRSRGPMSSPAHPPAVVARAQGECESAHAQNGKPRLSSPRFGTTSLQIGTSAPAARQSGRDAALA
jgi:hypothetical protein